MKKCNKELFLSSLFFFWIEYLFFFSLKKKRYVERPNYTPINTKIPVFINEYRTFLFYFRKKMKSSKSFVPNFDSTLHITFATLPVFTILIERISMYLQVGTNQLKMKGELLCLCHFFYLSQYMSTVKK